MSNNSNGPWPSLLVANWFIQKAFSQGDEMTAIKAQKLVYFSHSWCLALYDRPLIDECAMAFPWGPAFIGIYDSAIHSFGSKPITCLLTNRHGEEPKGDLTPVIPLLNRVWDVYGKHSAAQLARFANEKGGPWDLSFEEGREYKNIDEELIKFHFRAKSSEQECKSREQEA